MPVARAQDDVRTEQIHFDAGTSATTIRDAITGRQVVAYVLGAEAGQAIHISLSSDNASTYFNLYAPGKGLGDEALAAVSLLDDPGSYDGVLSMSGDYTISVYLFRNAARSGQTSSFSLDVSIDGDRAATVEGDYADGLQGGPDHWRVRVASGNVNLRSEPSVGGQVLALLANGDGVRNLGCRMNEGRRWCNVSMLEPVVEGWVAGDYLIESADLATPTADDGGDALVPGTDFNATGVTDCYAGPGADADACTFGVKREGDGNGTVSVAHPRIVRYEDGRPVGVQAEKREDGYNITIEGISIVLPDAVIHRG